MDHAPALSCNARCGIVSAIHVHMKQMVLRILNTHTHKCVNLHVYTDTHFTVRILRHNTHSERRGSCCHHHIKSWRGPPAASYRRRERKSELLRCRCLHLLSLAHAPCAHLVPLPVKLALRSMRRACSPSLHMYAATVLQRLVSGLRSNSRHRLRTDATVSALLAVLLLLPLPALVLRRHLRTHHHPTHRTCPSLQILRLNLVRPAPVQVPPIHSVVLPLVDH